MAQMELDEIPARRQELERRREEAAKIEDEQQLFEEIVGSKRELEEMIGHAVNYFAFPFGLPENMSEAAFRVAYQAGYWGVCSAYGGYNLPGDDAFHLQRIHGDPEWVRLRNWMTVDRRKLGRASRRRTDQQFFAGVAQREARA